MEKSPTSTYKIRFHDCDMFGHLNNARYLDYMISARQDHLLDAYQFDYNHYYKNGLGWVVSHHEIQYLKPAFFEETVLLQSTLLAADQHHLNVEVLMADAKQTHLKAILRSKLTFINLRTGRKELHSPEFMGWAKGLIPDGADPSIPIQERISTVIKQMPDSVKTS